MVCFGCGRERKKRVCVHRHTHRHTHRSGHENMCNFIDKRDFSWIGFQIILMCMYSCWPEEAHAFLPGLGERDNLGLQGPDAQMRSTVWVRTKGAEWTVEKTMKVCQTRCGPHTALRSLMPLGWDPPAAPPRKSGGGSVCKNTRSPTHTSFHLPKEHQPPPTTTKQKVSGYHLIRLPEPNPSTRKTLAKGRRWTVLTCRFLPFCPVFLLGHFQNGKVNICFKSLVAVS